MSGIIKDYRNVDIGKMPETYTLDSIRFSKLVNTHYFSEAANEWLANEKRYGVGMYTRAPFGSTEYREFWEEQYRRCIQGFWVGDMYITGRHYFYLNFFRMMRTPESALRNKNVISSQITKIESFPSFWTIQWLWFTYKFIAANGGSFLGVESPGGLDIAALKCRGAGFSFMDASDDVYNFVFYKKSKSFILAYIGNYLDGADGIMPKIRVALDFINTGTIGLYPNGTICPGYFKRNRVDQGKEPAEFKSGYKLADGTTAGFDSHILSLICDNPRKARAARGMKVTLEEGGSFPNLLSVDAVTQANVKDGGLKIGQRVLFGTGGEIGPGIAGLETIFSKPKEFGYMAFPNIWEGEMDTTGFFCPSFLADISVIDEFGNADISAHVKRESEVRQGKKGVSPAVYDKHVAEYCHVPSEALKRISGNVFPIQEVSKQLRKVQHIREYQNYVKHGDLIKDSLGHIEFNPDKDARPVKEYPHKQGEDIKGCVSVLDIPYNSTTGRVPKNMYYIVVDNYGIDEADDLTSLFACYVYKYSNTFDPVFVGLPVAWFVGRPLLQETAFKTLELLSEWYGDAEIMSERNASGQQIITYFKMRKKAHLLMKDLTEVGKETGITRKPKTFLAISADSKRTYLQGYAEWLLEERYVNDIDLDTNVVPEIVRNIDCIYDEGFLLEMLHFNINKGNFDRVSANILSPLIFRERSLTMVTESTEKNKFAIAELYASFHSDDVEGSIDEY